MAEGSYANKFFTPKNILLYIVVGAILYGAVYFIFIANKSETPSDPPVEEMNEQVVEDNSRWSIALDAQNDSGQSGTVNFVEANGKTTVTISLDTTLEDYEETPQPAHIHKGACPVPGAVVYPLTNVINGVSETVIDTTIADLKNQMPLAVNVHKSESESDMYVSCGDLE